MSLQVWLPLNGDLHNQGLNNIVFSNNGATTNTTGKIGTCYNFNGSSNYLYSNYKFYNNKYSICAWVYSTSSTVTQTICCDRTATGSGLAIFLINGKLRIDPGGNNLQWTTNYTYPINTWFHLTVTYDGTNVSYYINGEKKETKAQTISSSYWGNVTSIGASQTNGSGYGNYLNGKLNDIRIYNHCLSDKEVEEISKGLVLHYKLDNSINNIIYDCSGYNNNGTVTGDTTLNSNSAKYLNGMIFTSGQYIMSQKRVNTFLPTDKITVNIWGNFSSYAQNLISCTESGGWNFENSSGYIQFPVNIASVGYKSAKAKTALTALNGAWHMYTGVFDGSNVKLYIDGKLETSTATGSTNGISYGNTFLGLACEVNTNATPANSGYAGSISDCRIYASALNDTQIMELYNVSSTIDNLGNSYAREFIEDTNKLSITKTGIFYNNQILDDDDLSKTSILKTDKQLQSKNLYEY